MLIPNHVHLFLAPSDAFMFAIGLAGFFSLLVLVGAWRRQGRNVRTTATGVRLALGQGAAALAWLVFIGVAAWTIVDLGAKDLPTLPEAGWPPALMLATQIAAHVAALGGILTLIGIAPAFLVSGWSLWRKAHYLLFAAASLFAIAELWLWRAILAPHGG